MISPNTVAPPTVAPLTRTPLAYISTTMRTIAASTTGPPRTMPRNTERRDHSIWPRDRSKMRTADDHTDGALRPAAPRCSGSRVRGFAGPEFAGSGFTGTLYDF